MGGGYGTPYSLPTTNQGLCRLKYVSHITGTAEEDQCVYTVPVPGRCVREENRMALLVLSLGPMRSQKALWSRGHGAKFAAWILVQILLYHFGQHLVSSFVATQAKGFFHIYASEFQQHMAYSRCPIDATKQTNG